MNAIIRYFGLALVVAGAIRLWSHMTTETSLTVAGCFGNEWVIPVTSSPVAHCWGCYAIAAGLVSLVAGFIPQSRKLLSAIRIG